MKLSQIYHSLSKKCRYLSVEYNDKSNTITGKKGKIRFTVSESDKSFEIVFFDGKYNYRFPLKEEEVADFLSDLATDKINITNLNDRMIQINGWQRALKRKRSIVKAVICYIAAVAIMMFSLSGLVYSIQKFFDNKYGFLNDMMLIPWLVGMVIISCAMMRYARQQYQYRKNFPLYILGIFLISFSITLTLGLWSDYETDNRFGLTDYIGTSVIFLIVAVLGAGLIYGAYYIKKSNIGIISIFRIPILPPKEDAQQLIHTIKQTLGGQAIKMIWEPDADTDLFSSKIGGIPYWDLTRPYPVSSIGDKMIMIAQFRLDELPHNDFLPNEGLLQIFAENDESLLETKVIYHKEIDFSVKEQDILKLGITDDVCYEEGCIMFDFELEEPTAVKFEVTSLLYGSGTVNELMHQTACELGMELDETLMFEELDDSEVQNETENLILFHFNSGNPVIKSHSSSGEPYDVMLMCLYNDDYECELSVFANSENLRKLDFTDVCMKLDG